MIADYLSAEPAIITRLKDVQLAIGFKSVLGVADLASIEEATQQDPAAHVIYNGDILPGGAGSSAGNSSAQVAVQRWLVVIAVRNVRNVKSGSGARAEAGTLISKVIAALNGWAPTASHRPMRRVQAPRPGYNKGFAYFPLMFETQLFTGGAV